MMMASNVLKLDHYKPYAKMQRLQLLTFYSAKLVLVKLRESIT